MRPAQIAHMTLRRDQLSTKAKALAPVTFVYMKSGEQKTFQITPKIGADYRFFYATEQLPKEFLELDARPYAARAYFETFGLLQQSIENMIEEIALADVEEQKTKVILYAISYDTNQRGQQIEFRWKTVFKVETKRHTRDGQETETNFYIERKHGRANRMGVEYDLYETSENFDSRHDTLKEMPWSSDRETWFANMEIAIEQLGTRLANGFGSNSAVLAKRIDSHQAQFLLEQSKEGDE
jgi:hypothetical protein